MSALGAIEQAMARNYYPAYIGLDVHKETIFISVAYAGRGTPESRGEIANKPKKVVKLVEQLNQEFDGEILLFCYEEVLAAMGFTASYWDWATTAMWSRHH